MLQLKRMKLRSAERRTSILTYWTVRYLILISVGLVAAALLTFWWIRQEATSNRLQTAGLLAQEIADQVNDSGVLAVPPNLGPLIEDRKRFFNLTNDMCVIVTGDDGGLLYSSPPMDEQRMRQELNEDLTDARSPEFKAASAPVSSGGKLLGKVFVLQSKKSLSYIPREEVIFFSVLLLALIGLSWLTIYLLSRKLARPIQRVAAAASEISLGRYDVTLNAEAKEREIHELLGSFREMAGRLHQLEHSRSLMLAGVSHELKTPVTSIKGLVHAVREKVVEGDEAEEFLDIALLEAERLQRMVADLLDYNALAAGMVGVRHERLQASRLLSEIMYQWRLTKHEDMEEPELVLPAAPVYLSGDPLRIQQIVTNLLNNSLQAKRREAPLRLSVRLTARDGQAEIALADNGEGIPEDRRGRVFEPFFRSSERQTTAMRGLGLGLTFSRLLAEAMHGSLELSGRPQEFGCTIVLKLPLWDMPVVQAAATAKPKSAQLKGALPGLTAQEPLRQTALRQTT